MSQLSEYRQQKDAFFKESESSPLRPEQREAFRGLRYFDEAPELAIVAVPEILDPAELVEMQTSTGATATYLRWARAPFSVDGKDVALTVYKNPGSGDLFLPFQDADRGSETYGAGRYLDVYELSDGRLYLDFNYAYNPYCAYNDDWSCPLPPGENRLDVRIRAGEKTYHVEE
ncbi:MAG: DUF1684 domain-containing protein [Dehalococcoidia bacterium]|nr:DUF1684 domain-containing protein [Dehalococcoidia bacterium]